MLRLRLREGLTEDGTRRRFGTGIPDCLREAALRLPDDLVSADADGVRLTAKGFLVSNAILAELLKEC